MLNSFGTRPKHCASDHTLQLQKLLVKVNLSLLCLCLRYNNIYPLPPHRGHTGLKTGQTLGQNEMDEGVMEGNHYWKTILG